MSSPSASSSSSHTPSPTSSSSFSHFCACSTLCEKENKWQRSAGYARGSCCTLFRDGMQHPSGPKWSHGKAHACFIISSDMDVILDFKRFSSVFGYIRRGRSLFKKVMQLQQTSVCLTRPWIEELSEYNSVFYHFSETTFFQITNMAYLFLSGPCFSFIQMQHCLIPRNIWVQSLE